MYHLEEAQITLTLHYVLDLAGTLPLAYVDRNIFGANNFQTLLLESDAPA